MELVDGLAAAPKPQVQAAKSPGHACGPRVPRDESERSCDLCDFTCNSNVALKTHKVHMKRLHVARPTLEVLEELPADSSVLLEESVLADMKMEVMDEVVPGELVEPENLRMTSNSQEQELAVYQGR